MNTSRPDLLNGASLAVRPTGPPKPKFIEALTYAELGVTIGVQFFDGEGYLVVMRTPKGEQHLSPAAARRLASDLRPANYPADLAEVLAKLAAGLAATANQIALFEQPAEGRA